MACIENLFDEVCKYLKFSGITKKLIRSIFVFTDSRDYLLETSFLFSAKVQGGVSTLVRIADDPGNFPFRKTSLLLQLFP